MEREARSARNSVRRSEVQQIDHSDTDHFSGFSPLLTPQTIPERKQDKFKTLRDIYVDLPKSTQVILTEAGITNLMNCISIQKKLVLTTHYLLKHIGRP